jgi:ABC-type multidrug transport system ATPase subunit
MKGRTVVLVTHHVEICLPFAHSLIRVLDGRVDISGSVEDLRARGELSAIVAIEEASHSNEETVIPPTPSGSEGKEMSEEEAMAGAKDDDSKSSTVKDAASEQTVEAPKKKEARRLVKDEERAVGNVGWATYKIYLEATVSGQAICGRSVIGG